MIWMEFCLDLKLVLQSDWLGFVMEMWWVLLMATQMDDLLVVKWLVIWSWENLLELGLDHLSNNNQM